MSGLAWVIAGFGRRGNGLGLIEVIWSLISFAVLVGVIAFMVLLIRKRPQTGHPPSSALQILETRYARGEISREEFIERRLILMGHPAGSGIVAPGTMPVPGTPDPADTRPTTEL